MTRINKIVMHGFKSFAKRTEIPFGNDFNCVLGPNGSGKSNVMDALCFVLGKSSTKSLRAEKSANLIYNGGKSKKPSKSGEVSIYFDNKEKVFPTKDAEIKITRVVRSKGNSVYKINDQTRTRQQILDLLSIAKIDPEGYNIILQGDIVRFTEMPAMERRKLIEEISGISVYEDKKQKALNELNNVEGKLKEAEIVLSERGNYLKELEKDRNHALKYKDMCDKIDQNQASYLKLNIDRIESDKKSNQEKSDKIKTEIDKLNKNIEDIKKGIREKKDEIKKISDEIEQKGRKDQVLLNKEVENLKIDLTKKSARIETVKNEIEKVKKRKLDLKSDIEEINNKIGEFENKKKDMENLIAKKLREKSEFESKIIQFREKNKLDSVGDIEKDIDELDKAAEDKQKEIQALREEQHNLLREKDRVEHLVNVTEEKITKVFEVEKENKQQINVLKLKRDEFKRSTLDLNKRLEEDSVLSAKLANMRKEIVIHHETLSKLNARNIGIQERFTGDIAIKKILEQKNKISGIYGTVSELGNVSSKYSLALEIAAGKRMNSIVVGNDKVAATCIRYLKENKFGTATFLPLNKLKDIDTRSDVKALAKARGAYGLATDLVSYDTQFKKVFNYVFSNTIVVDNLNVARRIGIGSARMVTLDGDITDTSGAMHGGYRSKKRQGMGFTEKEVNSDIQVHEGKISELTGLIKSLESRRTENEDMITKLRTDKANLEGEIITMEKSLHLESDDLDISQRKKTDLAEELSKVDKNIREIEGKISTVNRTFTTIKIDKQKLKGKIGTLRDPRLIAELRAFEEKRTELKEQLIKYESEIKNIKDQITSIHKPELDKISQILKQLDKEEDGFIGEQEGLADFIESEEKVLQDKEEKAKEFYNKFKNLFDKRNKINDEVQISEKLVSDQQEKSREVEIKCNMFSLKEAELNAKLSTLNQEFEQYHGVKLDLSKSEKELKEEIRRFEKMKENIGSVNMRALEIYEEVEKEFNRLSSKKETLDSEREDVLNMMKEVEERKKELFMKTLDVVSKNFKQIFDTITSKGAEANLELETPEDPFDGGLMIKVKLTGTKFLDIRSLSGGEKTLTALAFIFAIQEHEPASFYVLDEVDAALDKHNSEKFAKLIAKYADRAQYIIISHNDGVISQANNLYGVSMNEHGMSKVVSLKI
ncbi:MAG: chromosome segregation protein SMC [Candidatus Woesearchaeota archaeon]|jgi:chromosome segregation protein|nr:chromosome segregation protein SMC [Candidatus Woesearchaeota archaeon]MDP7610532.1 chromosome segregation protein SMC [Candidatus Woesearchaeota archaeon]|tara:strand:+ start:1670 stop:5170 length:3501 start_codon:yes stop_codon:yes gene_type:complete